MRYKIVEVEDRGEYVVVRFRTKVDHEVAVPKGEDLEKAIEEYLDQYESVYPETKIEEEGAVQKVRDWIKKVLHV